MRKILYLLILLPFGLFGQNDFVRMIVTAEGEVQFMRGQQKLWVSAITSPPIYEADYYVAPWGNDDNPGTFEEPWQSWQKGFYAPEQGAIVYFRGGEYEPINTYWGVPYAAVYIADSQGEVINYFLNYPGETPILNCYTDDRSISVGIWLKNSKNFYIQGLEIKNALQALNGSTVAKGIRMSEDCDNITIVNCVTHDIEGPGMDWCSGSGEDGTVEFINCDSYNNYDPYSAVPGNQADGFLSFQSDVLSAATYTGCRAWNNSDDGFDTYAFSGLATYDSCWSFSNGWCAGNGFKMGPLDVESYPTVRRIYRNCLSIANGYIGYNDNTSNPIIMTLYNNIAYLNGSDGISMYLCGSSSTVRNNISYGNLGTFQFKTDGGGINDHNSWNGVVTCNDADFVSLGVNQLDNPRQADGSLPVVTYMHLVEGSDLIDAGVDVGLDYEGAAPDIGYAESNY